MGSAEQSKLRQFEVCDEPRRVDHLARSAGAAGRDLKASDPLHEEVDRFLRDTRSVLVVGRLTKLVGRYT